jgi:hypothetical protein
MAPSVLFSISPFLLSWVPPRSSPRAIPCHCGGLETLCPGAERFHNPLDSDTSRGPEWWFSARCVDKIWDSIALEIPFLNRQCKRVYRSLRSAGIRVLAKRRQLRLTSGRMRSTLASLLGTQRFSFLYDTLLCEDGSNDADPVVIHRSIQRH